MNKLIVILSVPGIFVPYWRFHFGPDCPRPLAALPTFLETFDDHGDLIIAAYDPATITEKI